ncbi:MAG TPA: hypothetical protein VHN99_06100, partial [Deinococcales bacterium]|nr:hypothetical protein [Deinococcales bacterium]
KPVPDKQDAFRPLRLAPEPAESADLDAPQEASPGGEGEPGVIVRRPGGPSDGIIRIGWQENDDWRPVVTPESARPAPAPVGRIVALVAAALVVIVLVVFGITRLRPGADNTPTATTTAAQTGGTVVTFKLQGAASGGAPVTGRLTALEVPPTSGLKAGDVLAVVPGPVLFPVNGTYRLRVNVNGYQAREFALNVTRAQDVVIKLNANP